MPVGPRWWSWRVRPASARRHCWPRSPRRWPGGRHLGAAGDEGESRLPFGLLGRLVLGQDPGWPATRPADPFAAGAAFLHLLGDLLEPGPVAMIVDDAHWADLPSLLALTFALRRLHAVRVLTVLALRPEDSRRLPSGLLRLAYDSGTRVVLTGLTADG